MANNNANNILEEAIAEVLEAKAKEAKGKIKAHLQKLEAAKLVVANFERELEVLLAQVGAELDG